MSVSKTVSFIVPLAILFGAMPVAAYMHGGDAACRQDIQKFCPDITPGPGAFRAYRQCLEDNAANLSPACQQERSQRRARLEEVFQACKADIETSCSDAGSDRRAVFKCLHQHRADLSPTCQDQLPHQRRESE
jgi:hypothetical protein